MQTRNILVLALLVISIGALVWWGMGKDKVILPMDALSDSQIEGDLSQDVGDLNSDFAEIDAGINGF